MKSYSYFEVGGQNFYPKDYLVSVAICSYKNLDNLKSTINSFIDKADNTLDNYEFIIKIDFDDIEAIDFIKNYNRDNKNISFIVSSGLEGYASLGEFWKDCTNLANGKYVMVIPDDCTMQTQNWNRNLIQHLTQTKIYFLNYDSVNEDGSTTNVKDLPIPWWGAKKSYVGKVGHGYWDFIFPIFPKKLIEIWGFISPHAQIDFWLGDIAKRGSTPPWNIDIYGFIDDVLLKFRFHESTYQYSSQVDRISRSYINSPLCMDCILKICNYRKQEELDEIYNKGMELIKQS
jgi:hypothetical protein